MIRALKKQGHDVLEVHYALAGSFSERIGAVNRLSQRIRFCIGIFASYPVLAWSLIRRPKPQVIIVGSPGYFHVHWAWLLNLLFRRESILVYDAFIPLYEALIEDRQLIRPDGLSARLIHHFEKSCCRIADLVWVDTKKHGQYLAHKYDINEKKINRLFVGSTIRPTTSPCPKIESDVFNILFVGTYIPLHGIDVILKAARLLKEETSIRFTLVGTGQLRDEMQRLASRWKLDNIIFRDWVPTETLYSYIGSFDLSLGIFGSTSKTSRVIPSKIYDICLVGSPFITAYTPAIREVFTHGKNAYLIPPASSSCLAEAIRHIIADDKLRKTIANGAKDTGRTVFSDRRLSVDLMDTIHFRATQISGKSGISG